MGMGNTVVLQPYNERFKTYRRLLKVGLNAQVAREYWPLMEQEIGRSLGRLLDNPKDYVHNFRRCVASVLTPFLPADAR